MTHFLANHMSELEKIFAQHKVRRADIFGSALTTSFDENSDIDILVTFSNDIELLEYSDNYFELKDKLEALLQREVDLVSSRALKNTVLIENINKSKLKLYTAESA